MRVLVVGGGISGPAVALALRRAGHDVELFDRVLDLLDTPPGLFIGLNGMRVLKRLDLLDQVVRAGSVCDGSDLRTIAGHLVTRVRHSHRADLFSITILRTTLSRIITNAAISAGVRVHTDKRLVAISQPPDGSPALGVVARFHDGSDATADILVGADGVHSTVRQCLFPSHRPPQPFGMVGYAGTVDLPAHSSAATAHPWPARNYHFFTDNANARSAMLMRVADSQLSWRLVELRGTASATAAASAAAASEISTADWPPARRLDLSKDRDRLADMADRWGLPRAFLPLVESANEIVPLAFYHMDAGPLPRWARQNCVLVGAAKHAILPFLGQATGVALEDAEVLAALIARVPDDPRNAFRLYQRARFRRVRRIADAARVQGRWQYATSAVGSLWGQVALKFVLATGGALSSHEVVAYDGLEAVNDVLHRNGLA
ncbi:hypothetical protein DFJ73DRAFT_908961 [Zopfochytrium polystomum]|nr:hypothetical protein DFJ73DRAFT_908961 [Zopfochytrium polystomum]